MFASDEADWVAGNVIPEPFVVGVAPPTAITPVTETLPYSVGLEVICELVMLPVICVLATVAI